jgi:phosphoenolpyruvate carboxykinase (GTP)
VKTVFRTATPSCALTTNKHLIRWVDKMVELCQPADIHWVEGSEAENDALCQRLVDTGTFLRLNQKLWPGCYYARSSPNDVARVGDRTFICSLSGHRRAHKFSWQIARHTIFTRDPS